MSIFSNKCTQCGSTEHATNDCPHGILSGYKCTNCDSTEHATNDCPHGLFSGYKCTQCDSTEHATSDCPHGILSGYKCTNCGSTEHATNDCPHGILSGKKSSEGEGIIATLANFAGMIGAGIGAIGGLGYAYDHSYGVLGYIISMVIGLLIGSAVGSIGVYLLFIGAGLFILVSILKACGVTGF